MAFHHLDRYARDNEATKAIFEHFRNVITAAAVGAAGAWLTKHAALNSFRGFVNFVSGAMLGFISLGLIWIVITNASYRLAAAGFSKKWALVLWGGYCAFAVTGLLSYANGH